MAWRPWRARANSSQEPRCREARGDRVPRDPRLQRGRGLGTKRHDWSGAVSRLVAWWEPGGSWGSAASRVVSRERVRRTQLFMRFRGDFDGRHRSGSVVTGQGAPQRQARVRVTDSSEAFASCGVPRYRRVTEPAEPRSLAGQATGPSH